MRSIRLPEDLRKYVRKKDGQRLLICLSAECLMILFLLFLGERIFSAMGVFLQVCAYVLLLALPFLLSGVPWKLIRRNWSGTVTDVRIETKTRYTSDKQTLQNTVILTLVDENGKSFQREVATHDVQSSRHGGIRLSTADVKVEHYMNEYSVGDEVYYFHGLPYPFVIGPNYRERITCVVCGQETRSEEARCWSCGHSLIKIKTDKSL